MKKILFTFLIFTLCIIVQGQKITQLPEVVSASDESLLMIRYGTTGNTLSKITKANFLSTIFTSPTFTTQITIGSGVITAAEAGYIDPTSSIQTQFTGKVAVADSGVYDGGYASMTNVNTQIEDTMTAYRAAAIPLETSAILGQITKVTIGWDGATGTDFVWAGDANHTAQNLDLGSIIPAKARVIAIEIVCTEALVGCTDITLGAGNASAGAQFIVAASCDDLNEVVGIINPALPQAVIMNWAAATKIWIIGDPTDNTWADMTAGKWAVYVTYIEYTDI